MSICEREKIQELLRQKKSARCIAKTLRRSVSSISRELRKNYPKELKTYTPRLANERALFKRTCRGRKDRLKTNIIREYVVNHLKLGWSPEQISGRIKVDLNENISHEAIYQYIYAQVYRNGWGYLKSHTEDLRIYLRRKRKRRAARGFRQSQRISARFGIPTIDQRPVIVAVRERIGDWEGDTVESKDHKPGINTLVDRKTGYLLMTKLLAKTSAATIDVIEHRLAQLPIKAKHTLTLDNGPENRDWRAIETSTGLDCF